MSLLDSIAEWIESKLVKLGLCKDRKEEERYAKYPNVDRKVQKEIYNTTFNYDFDPEVDIIIKDVIKFKDKATKFIHELCCAVIEFENGTTVRLWTENCWYGFLNVVEIYDKNEKNHKKFNYKRPSAETMISFLNAYSECFDIEEDRVTPKKSSIDNYYTKRFFDFDQKEEKSDHERQS